MSIRQAAAKVVSAIEMATPTSFFVGAGISKEAPSYLPDWAEFRDALLSAMIERLCAGGFLSQVEGKSIGRELLAYGSRHSLWLRPEVVLQWIYSYTPRAIQNMLQVFSLGHPNSNHRTLALLCACSNARVGTCNFDVHIEHALDNAEVPYQVFAGSRKSGRCRSFRQYAQFEITSPSGLVPILKIHGCVSAPSTIRATVQQESRPMPVGGRQALRCLARQRLLIVAGYSGRDFDILPEITAAAVKSRGVLWLARDRASVIPEVLKVPNTTFAMGDVNSFFGIIAEKLGYACGTRKDGPLSVRDHAQEAVRHSRMVPTALGIATLGMHIGCFAAVQLLSEKVVTTSSSRPRHVANALMSLGDTKRRSEPVNALSCFQEAKRIAHPIRAEEPVLYARTLAYVAGQHYLTGDIDKALSFNTRSTAWARKGNGRRLQALNMDDRALMFRHRGNVPYAIRLRLKSVSILEAMGDVINLAMVYNNLGKDYNSLDRFGEAEKWWRMSLKLKEKHTNNSPDIARTRFNLGELLRNTGRTEEAVQAFALARSRARMLRDRVVEARSIYGLAAIAFDRGKKTQARRLVALGVRKVSKADDWHGDDSRVKWAQDIERMIAGAAYGQ